MISALTLENRAVCFVSTGTVVHPSALIFFLAITQRCCLCPCVLLRTENHALLFSVLFQIRVFRSYFSDIYVPGIDFGIDSYF